MTRFEREYKEAFCNAMAAADIIRERKEEISRLTKEGKSCKNAFRRQCIAQDVVRLTEELNKLEELI